MTTRSVLPTQRLISLGALVLACCAFAPVAAASSSTDSTSFVTADSATPSPAPSGEAVPADGGATGDPAAPGEEPPVEEAPPAEGDGGNFVGLTESTNWWIWALVAIGLFFAIDIVLLLVGARKRQRSAKSRAASRATGTGLGAASPADVAERRRAQRAASGYGSDEQLDELQALLLAERDQLEAVRAYLADRDSHMQRDQAAFEEARRSIEAERDNIAERLNVLESENVRLAEMQATLEATRVSLGEERAALAAERHSFEADRERWLAEVEQRRKDAATASSTDSPAPDFTEISSDERAAEEATLIAAREAVMSEGERLETLQAALEVDLTQLAEEKRRSESLRYELEALRADLKQRDAELLDDRAAIEKAEAALDEERAALEAERHKLEAEREHRLAEDNEPREAEVVVEPDLPAHETAEPESAPPVAVVPAESTDVKPAIEEEVTVVEKAEPVKETRRRAKLLRSRSHPGGDEEQKKVAVEKTAPAQAPAATDEAWGSLSDEERAAFEAAALALTEGVSEERAISRGAAVSSRAKPATENQPRTKGRLWPSRSGRNKKPENAPVAKATDEVAPPAAQVWDSLSDEERAAFEAAALEFDLK